MTGQQPAEPEDSTAPWVRVLDEASAGSAIEIAQQIAHDLTDPRGPVDLSACGPTLGSGLPGIALFFTVLGEVLDHRAHFVTAMDLLNLAIEQTGSGTGLSNRFYGTPIGLGWAMRALEGHLYETEVDCSDTDELVGRLVRIQPWRGSYDLINGLVGLGTYSLARLPDRSAYDDLVCIVERLREIRHHAATGATWFTGPPTLGLFPEQAKTFPNGYYDLGFAHGVAGVIAFLAEALSVGIEPARVLLEDSVRWFRGHRSTATEDGVYPGIVAEGHVSAGCRMAWCYGDPGFAVALLAAGQALHDDDVVAEATHVARNCVGRVASSGIRDAGFCHGSAGAAHVFNRLGQALGDAELLDLARCWLAHTVERRADGEPVAGFPALRHVGPDNAAIPVPAADVLEGVAGVGLALLAAASDVEPWWDPMFFVRAARWSYT